MKIAGFAYISGGKQMYLKPDTALLVNKKPFFLPHFSEQIEAHPAVVARIDRMGRCIAPKFASRYYMQTAPAINFMACCNIETVTFDVMTRSMAFDNSMAVGIFAAESKEYAEWYYNGITMIAHTLLDDINKAVAEVSNYITLRTGDMVAVDYEAEPLKISRNDEFSVRIKDEELLFCRIK